MMKNVKYLLFLIVTSFLLVACSSNGSDTDTLYETTIDNSLQGGKPLSENNKVTTTLPSDISDITQETKDYILKGQEDKSEAEKIKWSETFLDQVNIEELYQEYLLNGGTVGDIQGFAQYLSLNAPVLDNWEDLVATDLLNVYDVEISHIEHFQDDLYQVYVEIDGTEVPYVLVNSKTGYFHG